MRWRFLLRAEHDKQYNGILKKANTPYVEFMILTSLAICMYKVASISIGTSTSRLE